MGLFFAPYFKLELTTNPQPEGYSKVISKKLPHLLRWGLYTNT